MPVMAKTIMSAEESVMPPEARAAVRTGLTAAFLTNAMSTGTETTATRELLFQDAHPHDY